ncbi:MAG: UDP-N-acetylmuramate--L-alanine ligase [Deltaproteobacteria bacterium]|nr:UDP-N-acetylmuramate--L-alanine ligase [Deltaproteobacteria bacterium]
MNTSTYHFIGIGGIGMSGLAELLVRQGHKVSGSDLAANAQTRRLQDLGVKFSQGHHPSHLGDAQVVVYSSAVKPDNPEFAAAKKRGLAMFRRGEMLARLMDGHHQISITGAHGKTSTTAMTAAILRAGGLDPTVMVGAVWDGLGSNAVLGRGEYFVAESDESDASFALLTPQVTVITNIDNEHLDYYRDLDHIRETFADYLDKLPPESLVVAWADDPHLTPLLRDFPNKVFYSLEPGKGDFWVAGLETRGLGARFRLFRRGRYLGALNLPLAGEHYVLNAMAACAVAHSLKLPFPAWQKGLMDLGQIHRRLQVKGKPRGVLVLDDYGHHPAEIATTLSGLARAFPGRRLVVAFQPHRYSRTQALLPEFFPVFQDSGLVFVTEIYSAGEPPVDGLSGRAIAAGIQGCGHGAVHFVEELEALADIIIDNLQTGDIVLTLGAGDIWKTGDEVVARLR